MSFNSIHLFEQEIASFFGAPYAVATDCCTHALELCLEVTKPKSTIVPICVPKHTYLSVPMMVDRHSKLNPSIYRGVPWDFVDNNWVEFYHLTHSIIDAAVLWRRNSFIPGKFMCLSFQFKKHLSLGRGGMILFDDHRYVDRLQRLTYDGRNRNVPWVEQTISEPGFHYYMTPEIAEQGLNKLDIAIATSNKAKVWTWRDYPDISIQPIFKHVNNIPGDK